MKFDVLVKNLFNEDVTDEQPAAVAPEVQPETGSADNIPTPDRFDDVKPMPQSPGVDIEEVRQKIAGLVKMADALNGLGEEESLQSYFTRVNRGALDGISKVVKSNIEAAAGYLLDTANALNTIVIQAKSNNAQQRQQY